MCGLVGYWAKESTINKEQWDILFSGAESRGRNGVGLLIFNTKSNSLKSVNRWEKTYSKIRNEVLEKLEKTEVGDIVLGICRATPETEVASGKIHKFMQPIVSEDLKYYLVHNGSITDSILEELKYLYNFTTKIDSEGIIAAYQKFNFNMKKTMEYLSGSFSFLMIDKNKKKLFVVSQFNPLAHSYIRGYGYFLHSLNDVLSKNLYSLTGQTLDGMNVWESWYHHDIDSYTIIETDLESGFQFKQTFEPRFLHPTWDSRYSTKNEKTVLVIASGGIDSGLTGHVLKIAGYNPVYVHFSYGQRGEEAELLGIQKLSKYLDIPLIHLDLKNIFINFESMLIGNNIQVNTGTPTGLKSTMAWVPGRNAIFSTIVAGIAENIILKNNIEKIHIASGFSQLSEETSGYPDNSVRFIESLENMFRFGYITGNRISFLPVMSNLLKTEEWILGDKIGFPFEYTVSCDQPKVINGKIYLCTNCGSTKLSIWAAKRAGIRDPRKFYKLKDFKQEERRSKGLQKIDLNILNIINKIGLDSFSRERIKMYINNRCANEYI